MIAPAMLALSAMWLGWTVLVDFFLVPAVFATIPDFFLAGEMGIQVFSRLNRLEFPLASILLALAVLDWRQRRWPIPVNVALVGLAGVYLFSLTPKIAELSGAWAYAERMGTLGAAGAEDVQQLHQQYHRTYVALDTVKLVLLAGQVGFLSWTLKTRNPHAH
jgi:hypothetical protein